MKEKSTFGKNLSKELYLQDINQLELSKKLGLTEAAISQIISGKREPSLSIILKILKVLPIKFERLIK